MNYTLLLAKATLVIFILCVVVSFSYVEANHSVRIRPKRITIAPKYVSKAARSSTAVYARKYDYGRPIPHYTTKGPFPLRERNRRYFRGRRNGKREVGARNYASGYRNWTPNRSFPGTRNNPRIDNAKKGFQKKRKEPYPFLKEPHYGTNKQKRRIRPQRPNGPRRPFPPKKLNEYDEDYFFPEEAKRTETRFESEDRFRPKKRRRNPGEGDKSQKKPDLGSKVAFYDEKTYSYKKKNREPPVSYSTFIQHPSATDDEPDEYYGDADTSQYTQTTKTKKKRVKKKNNSKKKNKEDDYYKPPYAFEKDSGYESYPPYVSKDEYELPSKSSHKISKPTFDTADNDDFLSKKTNYYSKPKPQATSIFSSTVTRESNPHFNDFKNSQNTQDNSQFSPSLSQPWSHSSVVETTSRPVHYKTENGFQPQQYVPNQYTYQNRDYSSVQKTKTAAANVQQSTYYAQPDNTYNKQVTFGSNYVSNQVSTNSNPSNFNYNSYSSSYQQPTYQQPAAPTYQQSASPTYQQSASPTYQQSASPTYQQPASPTYHQPAPQTYQQPASPTYQQPISTSATYNSDVIVQKSVPIYDNTETFYNFNNNAYVNSQSSKFYETSAENGQKYGQRISDSIYRNSGAQKTDNDNEFIKKHQNLYNNGLAGVPVQGDGFGKDNRDVKKDYDIGYGDFQFDENPSS